MAALPLVAITELMDRVCSGTKESAQSGSYKVERINGCWSLYHYGTVIAESNMISRSYWGGSQSDHAAANSFFMELGFGYTKDLNSI